MVKKKQFYNICKMKIILNLEKTLKLKKVPLRIKLVSLFYKSIDIEFNSSNLNEFKDLKLSSTRGTYFFLTKDGDWLRNYGEKLKKIGFIFLPETLSIFEPKIHLYYNRIEIDPNFAEFIKFLPVNNLDQINYKKTYLITVGLKGKITNIFYLRYLLYKKEKEHREREDAGD